MTEKRCNARSFVLVFVADDYIFTGLEAEVGRQTNRPNRYEADLGMALKHISSPPLFSMLTTDPSIDNNDPSFLCAHIC